jgi:hypothetical protein
MEYTKCIDFEHNIWLQWLTPENCTNLFGAFAAAIRHHQFSRPDKTELCEVIASWSWGLIRASGSYGKWIGSRFPLWSKQSLNTYLLIY